MKKRAASLVELLSTGDDTAPVFGAPGMPDLTYGALRKLIIGSVKRLNLYGLGRNDRIAIVLKNGPEMAVSFLAVACGTTSAPLNPAYRADEFEFYLSDLNAKALIVEAGTDTPAIGVAQRLGITIIDLVPTPDKGAGKFHVRAPWYEGSSSVGRGLGPAR